MGGSCSTSTETITPGKSVEELRAIAEQNQTFQSLQTQVLQLLADRDAEYSKCVTAIVQKCLVTPQKRIECVKDRVYHLALRSDRCCKLVFLHLEPKVFREWAYYELALQRSSGTNVVELRTDGNFFWSLDVKHDPTLDVSMWQYHEGNTVNLVAHKTNRGQTRIRGGGRSFCLQKDGRLASRAAGEYVLGVNDSGRLALVRKNSPKCCVLVEKTEYAALAAFKGSDATPLSEEHTKLLFALSAFTDQVHPDSEQHVARAARMLLHYTALALEPQITAMMRTTLTDLSQDHTAPSAHSSKGLLAMARCLSRGESSPKSKAFSVGMSRQEKDAVAWMQVANMCSSESIKEAAAELSPIVQKSYFRALDTPFIPDNILSMVNKNDMAIRKHWQRDFSPLAPYAVAHASMCVHPRFLHNTILMERVAAMDAGALADEDVRARMGGTAAMEQIAAAVIKQAYGLKSRDAAKSQTDTISKRNILSSVTDCFNHLQPWQKPYYTLALQSLGGADADRTATTTKLAEICDRSIHCAQMKATAFDVLVRHVAQCQRQQTATKTVGGDDDDESTGGLHQALQRVHECMADYMDSHKDLAFKSAFVEPAKYFACHSKHEKWVEDNVETHAINYYGALVNSALGVALPFMPLYWENWPETVTDFWAGLHDRCWEEFSKPRNFGLGHRTIKAMRKPAGFVSNGSIARAQFPVGRRPPEALQFANDAVDPDCPASRTKTFARYLERFALFFSRDFFVPKAFNILNSEQRPEHHGFRKASETLYQAFRAAHPGVATADTFLEFCFEDDMFTRIAVDCICAFWEWIGLLRAGTSKIMTGSTIEEAAPRESSIASAAAEATSAGAPAAAEATSAGAPAAAEATSVGVDTVDQELVVINQQLAEATQERDVSRIKTLMLQRKKLMSERKTQE